jgi:hypothetical protein
VESLPVLPNRGKGGLARIQQVAEQQPGVTGGDV